MPKKTGKGLARAKNTPAGDRAKGAPFSKPKKDKKDKKGKNIRKPSHQPHPRPLVPGPRPDGSYAPQAPPDYLGGPPSTRVEPLSPSPPTFPPGRPGEITLHPRDPTVSHDKPDPQLWVVVLTAGLLANPTVIDSLDELEDSEKRLINVAKGLARAIQEQT